MGELEWIGRRVRPGSRLSVREREVLELLATGEDLQGVARSLSLAPATARTHLRTAMLKLGARSRPHAIALGIAAGEIQAA